MARKAKPSFMGPRLRRLRREMGITQSTMAEDLGVSSSYIALMERNQRPMTADTLLKLAATYKLDIASLISDRSDEFSTRMSGAFEDSLFTDLDIAALDVDDIAKGYPVVAEAMLRLYTAYREGQLALADKGDGHLAAPDPISETRRFLSARLNFFPEIDERAQSIARKIQEFGNATTYLFERHGLKVRRLPSDVMAGSLRRLDRHRNALLLDETIDRAGQAFQIFLQIAYLEMQDEIDRALTDGGFVSSVGEQLARRSLANYAAGAILMPYREFARAAEARRYDIEVLSRMFGASFEQVAHRLTTLQKPEQQGVPFFFIRVDVAGNVSKRLDGAGFPFARHGGSCPVWSLHQVFRTSRKIIPEWVELAGGEKFFSIARSVTGGGGAFGAPRVERAIALGCAAKHAHRLIYADHKLLDAQTPTPIGVTCRLCHRIDCTARAEPPLGRNVLSDEYRRTTAPFGFSDS